MSKRTPKDSRTLGLDAPITRRDFVGATLIGSGALLLGAAAPSRAQGLTSAWNGYPGVGDYARSNGNVASVVNAAHGVRDGIYEARLSGAPATDEPYDLVIVGGGFSGIIAAYEFTSLICGTTSACPTNTTSYRRAPLPPT